MDETKYTIDTLVILETDEERRGSVIQKAINAVDLRAFYRIPTPNTIADNPELQPQEDYRRDVISMFLDPNSIFYSTFTEIISSDINQLSYYDSVYIYIYLRIEEHLNEAGHLFYYANREQSSLFLPYDRMGIIKETLINNNIYNWICACGY